MRKLFLDVDDTLIDTEGYLRSSMRGNWGEGLFYNNFKSMSLEDIAIVQWLMSDYTKIPMLQGAEEGLSILRRVYDIILCTSCSFSCEKHAKKKLSDNLGIPIIICEGEGWDKSFVDMAGGIFVDNNTRILLKSNAQDKICFYQKGNFLNKDFPGVTVFNWQDLLKVLV